MRRAHGLQIPESLEDVCHPSRLALVVYDMQVGILRQLEDGDQILSRVGEVTMSAFAGTPLDIVLRDCGLMAFAIAGVATEIGVEPTARHGADLGYIPVVVTDACGAGNPEAAERSLASLGFAGDSILTDRATICPLLESPGP